jgi:hypothetical protein
LEEIEMTNLEKVIAGELKPENRGELRLAKAKFYAMETGLSEHPIFAPMNGLSVEEVADAVRAAENAGIPGFWYADQASGLLDILYELQKEGAIIGELREICMITGYATAIWIKLD